MTSTCVSIGKVGQPSGSEDVVTVFRRKGCPVGDFHAITGASRRLTPCVAPGDSDWNLGSFQKPLNFECVPGILRRKTA